MLRDATRAQLDIATKSLEQARHQLAVGDTVLEHLKRYGYKIDSAGGQVVPTLTTLGIAHLLFVDEKKGEY